MALNEPTTGTYDTKDVGTGKTVTVSGLSLSGADAADYTVANSISSNIGQITARDITASLTGPITKTYDGGTTASLTSGGYTLNGIVAADAANLGLTASSGTYAGKDAGSGLGVGFTGLALTGSAAGDYTLDTASFSGPVGVINPLSISASLTGPITKTYDGGTTASLAGGGYTLNGVIGTDSVSLTGSGTYDTKDAGTNKFVSFISLGLAGADAGDYSLSTASFAGLVGVINPLAITASLTGTVSKAYDGTTTANLSAANYSLSSSLGSDVVGLASNTTGTYDTKDVGTGKTVTVTGLSLTGADAGDYTLASTTLSGAIGTITAKTLTASLTGLVSKPYDGTTVASLTPGNYSLLGVVSGDTVGLSTAASGTYDTKDAGTGKTVTVTGLALTGADAGDYSIASSSLSGAVGTITPLALTASLIGTVSKTYDGGVAANLSSGNYTLSSPLGSDVVSLAFNASGTYDTKDVGAGKTVTVTGLALTGADAGDYSLASTTLSGAIGTITAKTLTASLTGLVSKPYDGTTVASLTPGNYSLLGVVSGDTVGLSTAASGTYDTKDAGTGKTVTVTGLALTGADAGDYAIASSSLSGAVGTITPLALTVSLLGQVSKTYDGTTVAALTSGNYSLTGVIAGDAVALNDPTTGAYDTKDVGTGKMVTVAGLALTGVDAGDYSVSSSISGAIGTITPLALTASLTGTVSKTYDGTTIAALTSGNYSLSGVISGDTVGLSTATSGTYDTKDAGTGKTVTVTGLVLTGADAGDYSIASSSLSGAVGTITPLALAVGLTGTTTKTYDGTTVAALTSGNYSLAGVIAGDTVALNAPTTGTYDTKDVGTGKIVTAAGLALTGADAGDYSVSGSISGAIGTITPKALTASVSANDKVYDGGLADTGSASLGAGVVAGDQVAVSGGSFSFATPDAGTNKAVSVTGLTLTGADASDYIVSFPSSALANITARPVTIAANDISKVDGLVDPPLTYSIQSGSLVSGDQVSGDLARAPGNTPGNYVIGQGDLSLSSNYALSFIDGVFTILPPSSGLVAFAPANGASFNASNGASSFSTGSDPTADEIPAPSSGGHGSAPSAPGFTSLQPSEGGDTNAPYPNNRYVSDSIRFTIGMNP